jgi:hypothetical protein
LALERVRSLRTSVGPTAGGVVVALLTSPTARRKRNDSAPDGRKNVDPFPLTVTMLPSWITGRAVPPSLRSSATLNS